VAKQEQLFISVFIRRNSIIAERIGEQNLSKKSFPNATNFFEKEEFQARILTKLFLANPT
jgi:hypothetical protein